MILLFADEWRAGSYSFDRELGRKAWSFKKIKGDPEIHKVLQAKYVNRMNNEAWIYDKSGCINPVRPSKDVSK